ncbi:FecR family protein [Sphingosinicella rhizophila]|uniref:FecR domain-containing protein n=1 Tax=Sphingosinicella rhizophila TaxID=3050082 RepID=A0ABU3QA21_9SPHN|nr:FecR domain-containing protein [Sphingosinicella sp. GR2756]MDT9600261.1 FecR domain-containing protein [Sphingosinicella sp. GR2756]
MTSETWELAGGITAPPRNRQSHRPVPIAAMAISFVLIAGLVGWQIDRGDPIDTAVGEQRSVKLADGSVVTLNTATELSTHFSADRRLVRLDEGEASFDVAKDSLRPFIVEAGDARVVAVGTIFDVRYMQGVLAVTLAEGRVRVVDTQSAEGNAPAEVDMKPGQRLVRLTTNAPARVAAVNLQNARAWRSGQVVFADTPLAAAVREMNRYTDSPIRIADDRIGSLRISGSFRATDTAQFARAVADIYALRIDGGNNAMILTEARPGRP